MELFNLNPLTSLLKIRIYWLSMCTHVISRVGSVHPRRPEEGVEPPAAGVLASCGTGILGAELCSFARAASVLDRWPSLQSL